MAEHVASRSALIVATGQYDDARLAALRAPAADAEALAAVLLDETRGDFDDVDVLLDPTGLELRLRLSRFFDDRRADDLLVMHFSCHGVKDVNGQLYFAATDTDFGHLHATGVGSSWLKESMERCASRRMLLMLDCCNSGAFARGMLARGDEAVADSRGQLGGHGRVIITASDAVEYAFEGDEVEGTGSESVFTSAVVEALRDGAADRDGDGWISHEELHRYVRDTVRDRTPNMTPQMSAQSVDGALLLAHNPEGPRIEPAPLPDDLVAALESRRPSIRQAAVLEVGKILTGSDAGQALTARRTLEEIAGQDIPIVADPARKQLGQLGARAQPPKVAPTPGPGTPPEPETPLRLRIRQLSVVSRLLRWRPIVVVAGAMFFVFVVAAVLPNHSAGRSVLVVLVLVLFLLEVGLVVYACWSRIRARFAGRGSVRG